MPDTLIITILLGLSLILSGYLLFILNQRLKPIYGDIWAWRLIFAGYVLLFVEIGIGLVLVLQWLPVYTRFFNIGFCAIMLTKVTLYVLGFRMWAKYRRSRLQRPPAPEE